jgi:hypothetical protein
MLLENDTYDERRLYGDILRYTSSATAEEGKGQFLNKL